MQDVQTERTERLALASRVEALLRSRRQTPGEAPRADSDGEDTTDVKGAGAASVGEDDTTRYAEDGVGSHGRLVGWTVVQSSGGRVVDHSESCAALARCTVVSKDYVLPTGPLGSGPPRGPRVCCSVCVAWVRRDSGCSTQTALDLSTETCTCSTARCPPGAWE